MNLEEFNAKLALARESASDTGKLTEILTEVREGGSALFGEKETAIKRIEQLEKDNKSLLESNMKLFLKIGTPVDGLDQTKLKQEEEKMKFEDLFNEKGGLK